MSISLISKLSILNEYLKKYDNEFLFRDEDYNNFKSTISNEITEKDFLTLAYLLTQINNIEIKAIQLAKIKKKTNIISFFTTVSKKIYANIDTYNLDDLVIDIKNELDLVIPEISFSKYKSDIKYMWLFKINQNLEMDDVPDISDIPDIFDKIVNFILKKIHKNIVITIDNIQFIVLSFYTNEKFHRSVINLISHDRNNINNINNLSYYRSNSELGLMRFMAIYKDSHGNNLLAKYLDYATETLIDMKLQKEINNKIVNYNNEIKKEKIFDILEWNNPTNLNLLRIDKIDNNYVEKRGYFSPMLYCFSSLNCGEVFKGYYIDKIYEINDIMIEFIKLIQDKKNNYNSKDTYDKMLELTHGSINYIIDNFILFNNIETSQQKIMDLINIGNEYKSKALKIERLVGRVTCEYLSIHYRMLGKMLNIIIDEIIGDEKTEFEYSYELSGYTSNIKYIFNVKVNKLLVKIDYVQYNLYYNEYNVKIKYDELETDFNDEILIYRSIVKIVPSSVDNLINSGVSDTFTIAGSLQCKPIEYKIQLTGVLNEISHEDNNDLNHEYYFIGTYINEMFEEFTKFNDFLTKNLPVNLKNKYLKYKKKYLNAK